MLEEKQKEEEKKTDRKELIAIFCMMFAATSFSLGFLFANEHKFHPITTALVRGLVTIVISYSIGRYQKIDLTFKSRHNFKWQMIRNIIMTSQGIAIAWVQFYLPLPIVITLNSASPIFTAIFDRMIYGIKLNKTQIAWLAVAFVGVILTANGRYISYLMRGGELESKSKFENYMTNDSVIMMWAAILYTLVMCTHGFAVVMTKELKNTSAFEINYFLGVLIITSSAVFLPNALNDPNFHQPTWWELFQALLVCGLPMTLAQLSFFIGLLLTKNYGMVTPFQFVSIIVGYVVSIVRYDESIDLACLLGAIGIVLGVVFIARYKDPQPVNK